MSLYRIMQEEGDEQVELVVRYSGDIVGEATALGAQVEVLSPSYAIVTIAISAIDSLYRLKSVEFIEVPKRLYFMAVSTLPYICVYRGSSEESDLKGRGTLIGIIDSGIDILNRDFITEEGITRIATAWAQSEKGKAPEGFYKGREYTRQDINRAIAEGEPTGLRDTQGHGTAVAGIAAGNGIGSGFPGVAPEAELIVVKLDEDNPYSRSTDIMRGLKFIRDRAQELNRPVAINLSYGTNEGTHDGSSLFEGYINELSETTGGIVCVATGNEGVAGHHYKGDLREGSASVAFNVAPGLREMYITLWKDFSDRAMFGITAPGGSKIQGVEVDTFGSLGDTQVSIIFSPPTPYSIHSEVYISLRSEGELTPGLWSVDVEPVSVTVGEYHMWLPVTEAVGRDTAFLQPDAATTLTIPSTAYRALTVAGYNQLTGAYADFSGRGYTGGIVYPKPDITAPAYNVPAPLPGGGYDVFTGTSFAVPHATGVAALIMEWGIVQGNDLFMYGERLKAYMQRGSVRDGGEYPNPISGYGRLCFEGTMSLLTGGRVATQELRESPYYSEYYLDFVQRQNSFIDTIGGDGNIVVCPINGTFNGVYVRADYYEENRNYLTNTYGIRSPFLMGLMDYGAVLDKSGITNVHNQPYLNLRGNGIIVAVVDTGIDYRNSDFIYEDGTSKILYLWDQAGVGEQGGDLCFGREYTNEDINRAIRGEGIIDLVDETGHGTAIASLAAGRRGAAPDTELIIVRVKPAKAYLREEMFLDEATPAFSSLDVMLGVSYAYRRADELNRPVVICMGMGTNQGGHSGQSSLEEYFTQVARAYGVCLCVPAGNEGTAGHHASVEFNSGVEYRQVEVNIGEGERGVNIWIWNFIVNSLAVEIISPLGEVVERLQPVPGYRGSVILPRGGGVVEVSYFIPEDIASDQYTLIRISRPATGIWTLRLYNYNSSMGKVHLWLPVTGFIGENTFFLNSDPAFTVTTPGTGTDVMVVGGYNSEDNSIYPPTGRGPTRFSALRPYFCAPCVNIQGRSGTSLAVAVAGGAAALMLEWLILRNGINTANTLMVTSYFVRGAVTGDDNLYPNNQWGYGRLDLYNSFKNL